MKNVMKFGLALCGALVLAGCGGGGGGGGEAVITPTTPVDYPLKTAYVNYLTSTGSHTFSISGTFSTGGTTYPLSGNGTGTYGALTAATFEGVSALSKASTVVGTIVMNGSSLPLSVTGYSYFDSNYTKLGESGTEYTVVTSIAPLPNIGHVNDTGIWYTSKRYQTSAKTSLVGTESVSYVIESDSATTSFLRIISIQKNNAGTTTSSHNEKYRMTTTGALTPINDTGYQYNTSDGSMMTLTLTYGG